MPPCRIQIEPSEFRAALLDWFDMNKRDLPWRRTRDPYAIWVSEIMLQQTRVAAVLEYYARFMNRFPTVAALAAAPEADVLTHWSGLGYYRRAKYLHNGAKSVMAQYGGEVPQSAALLRTLPGIGDYTSAAIGSIAFGEPTPAVDGNVERVVLRLVGEAERGGSLLRTSAQGQNNTAGIKKIASTLLDPQRPGDFNQAMMELGATVCLPRSPLCLHCPVQRFCRTRGEHPTIARKPAQIVETAFALVQRNWRSNRQYLVIERSRSETVMPGMWELPRSPDEKAARQPLFSLRHSIMNTTYRVAVVVSELKAIPEGARWVSLSEAEALPLTGLARKIFRRLRGS